MKISRKGRQSAAWLCTVTVLISSVFGNTVWAGQNEDWITKGSHSYHDCLIDEDCLEEMTVLFEDEEFLEEHDWTEEQGQREMLKEMLRIYNLFGKEPFDGWDAYADLADMEIASNSDAEEESAAVATASNAEKAEDSAHDSNTASTGNAGKATDSNAEKNGETELATASNLPSEFAELKKEVRGELPEYQEYYCAELMDDIGVELMNLEEDGSSAGIILEANQRPHVVIKGEKEVYAQIFANACENETFTFEVCGVDAQGREMQDQTFTRNPRMWDLQDQNWYNNSGFNNWHAPSEAKKIRLTMNLSEGALEKGFYFAGEPVINKDGNVEFQIAQSRGRHVFFSYPTAGSFGGSSSDDGQEAVLTFKDFAVFTNELYGTIGHIEGNIAVGKVTGASVDTSTNQNVLNIDGDSSRITYLKYPGQSLPIRATQGSHAEIVLGDGADIWVGTNGHGNKGEWYVKFPTCGYDTLVGSSGQVQYITNENDTDNGGFSIDISRALNTLSGYHPADNAEAVIDERSIVVDCEQETTVVTVKAKDLEKEWFKPMNFDESKTLIINVDIEGASDITIRTAIAPNGGGQLGDWKALAGNIVWNFGGFRGKVYGNIINSGLLLVPKGDVELYANWNGCIAADRVANPGAEIHKVKPEIDDPEPEPTTTTTESTTSTTKSTTSTTESTTSTTESTTTTVTEPSTETTTESTTSTSTTTTETTSTTTTKATTKPTTKPTTSTTTTKPTTSTTTTKPTTSTTTTKSTTSTTTTKATTKPTTSTTTTKETTKPTTSTTTTKTTTKPTTSTTTTKPTTSTTTKSTTSTTTTKATTKPTTSTTTTTTTKSTTSTTTTKATTKPTTSTTTTTTTKPTTSTTTTKATTKPTTSTTTTKPGTSSTTTTKGGTKHTTERTTGTSTERTTGSTTERTTGTSTEHTTVTTTKHQPTTVTESSTETTSESTTTTRATTTKSTSATTSATTTATVTTRGGSHGGGGNGGSHGGGSHGGGTPTVPLVDNPVPLANLPEDTNSDVGQELMLIDDPDVPLAALPKTGDSSGVKFALFVLSLSALAVQLRKRREEKEHES